VADRSSNPNNPLLALRAEGQSVWLDFIRRGFIESGELKRLVVEDKLGGLTSNPAIFEKAIGHGDDYTAAIRDIVSRGDAKSGKLPPKRIFELLAVKDIQDAADVLAPVYEETAGRDGFVSLEVAPDLANDSEGTLSEARRLWAEVERPNLMVKVPATRAGLPVIQTLLTEGINVNITLLFARSVYEKVALLFIEALEARVAQGLSCEGIASVASFFVSRIDTSVDAQLAKKIAAASGAEKAKLEGLVGKVAIANAKLAYRSYERIFSGPRWEALAARGAQSQRVLWASTGVKNPAYRDTLYVEQLIGPRTINTMPPETLAAMRDHGRVARTLTEGVSDAERVLSELESVGISLERVTDELLIDGVKKFADPYLSLLQTVEKRSKDESRKVAAG
jgi:transaldolase/glucose-6-phosphate isomerase